MISVRDLNIYYGQFHAVKSVSFDVQRGEIYGLVGESGSGKSTVLSAICGLTHSWDGSISIDGQKINPVKKRPRAFYKLLQMVFQDPFGSLHPHHTVDRILCGPARTHGLQDIDERLRDVLDAVGLEPEFRFRLPHQLSGGQRQRVAIARALILDPRVILLDEPTSALDASIQAEILNLLMRLRHERDLTYVLVSHDLSTVSYMCDRVTIMEKGKVVETAHVDDLATNVVKQDYTRRLLEAAQFSRLEPGAGQSQLVKKPYYIRNKYGQKS